MDTQNVNLLGIIGLIGAIIMIVGVFMTWIDIDYLIGKAQYSGWDIFSNKDGVADNMQYSFVPLLAVICGVISLLLMIVPTFMNTDKYEKINNILGLIALILSVIVVICGILFYLQTWDAGLTTVHLSDYIQFGFWLVIIGGIITLIGGIMPIVKNKYM